MSGILKRTMMMCRNKDGVQDSGWRRCITGEGSMLEPASFSQHLRDRTDDYDFEYSDMISHVDDLQWIPYGNWNILSGTPGGVAGSEDGFVHGGILTYYEQV